LWASAEYLLWWVKTAPVSVPTLTTFAPGSPSATTGFGGALGVAGTTVLSPDHLVSNPFSGGRFLVGGWIDCDQRFGIEIGGFLTENRTDTWSTFSSPGGLPSLRIPFFNVPPGDGFPLGESSFVLSDPGFANGGQMLVSSLNLWGTEGHLLFNVVNSGPVKVALVGGFQYLNLTEGLSIIDRETLIGAAGFGTYSGADGFDTRNQFYGGQLGAKAEGQYGRFFASILATVALGANEETVTINGISTVTPPGGTPVTTPGGIFAQATNSGQQNRSVFAVVPEVQMRVGASLNEVLRVFVGYDFLYESDVVRPGDQIDRTLNLTSNAAINGSTTPLPLAGVARPEPLFNHTDFWAQGLTFGVELRY
jgi:hypothetical protein